MGNLIPGEKYEYVNEDGKVYAIDRNGNKTLIGEIIKLDEVNDERETITNGRTSST